MANINCERTTDPPWGLHGGKPGAVNEAVLIARRRQHAEAATRRPACRSQPGDRLTFLTAGGGGYGDPRGAIATRSSATSSPRATSRRKRRGATTATRRRARARRSRGCCWPRRGADACSPPWRRPASTHWCSTAMPGRATICAMPPISASWKATASRWSSADGTTDAVSRQRHRSRARRGGDAGRRRSVSPPTSPAPSGARLDRVANHRLARRAAPPAAELARRRKAAASRSRTAPRWSTGC